MSSPKPKESRLVRGLWWALAISIPTVLYGYAGWSMWREAMAWSHTQIISGVVCLAITLLLWLGWLAGRSEPRR